MRSLQYILLFLLSLTACSTTRDQVIKNTFTFYYQGAKHQIISKNTVSGEGSNFLINFKDGTQPVTAASDIDQDGTLDVLLDKSSSLDFENDIYRTGIMIAMRSGNYRVQETLRTYEISRNDSLFTIKTYMETEMLSNLYLIKVRSTGEEFIFRDREANGVLDLTEKGTAHYSDYQSGYSAMLNQGVKEYKITLTDGVYTVNKLEKVKTSHYDTAAN